MHPLTEHQIQDQIIQYLGMKGYYVQRLNSGMIRATNRYGAQHMIRMTKAGTPDIMAFKKVVKRNYNGMIVSDRIDLLFVEVKRPGKKPTPLQRMKMQELESFGARCIVATSVEDVAEEIR